MTMMVLETVHKQFNKFQKPDAHDHVASQAPPPTVDCLRKKSSLRVGWQEAV